MISSSSRVTACTAQAGSSAISVARRPNVIDLGCGFQADLPSGTRSSTRRVAAISSSNSGISHSASGMRDPPFTGGAKVVTQPGWGKQVLALASSSPPVPLSAFVLTPLIPPPFGRGETQHVHRSPSPDRERGTGGEDIACRRRICLRNTDSALALLFPPQPRSDRGERHAHGHLVPVGRSPPRTAARAVVAPAGHGRSHDAGARLPEKRVRRPAPFPRERAIHLHPGGRAPLPGGRGRRRGDRGARGGGAAPAGARAARGARPRGHARRGRVLPAAGGLVEQDGRVLEGHTMSG